MDGEKEATTEGFDDSDVTRESDAETQQRESPGAEHVSDGSSDTSTDSDSRPSEDTVPEPVPELSETLIKPVASAMGDDELNVFAETLVREQQNLEETQPETSLRPKSSGSTFGIDSVSVGSRKIQSATRQPEPASPSGQGPSEGGVDYLTIDLLGEGGMGTVHLARQVALGREVALKQIRREHQQQGASQDEFLTEAVLTGKLEHPNIVPVYEVGRSPDGDLFYSMKNVRGRAWSDTIGSLSLQENLDILINVCDAIAFAHAEGVVHRDLKPQNIMTGGFGEVLVLDWGLAIVMGTDSQTSASIAGTPAYMAPEMVNAPETVGPHSDVYLLGAILFKILSGKAPHRGRTGRDCLRAVAQNEIDVPDRDQLETVDLSGELLQIALRAMASDPGERFPTASAFQQAVRDYLLHRDSLEISSRAEASLEAARSGNDYSQFSRAVFGFEEAARHWESNTHAVEGVDESRLAWARCAENLGDFDLCLSLLDELATDQTDIRERVIVARDEREARKRHIRRLRFVSLAASLSVAVVASVAAVWINAERTAAIIAKQDEVIQRGIAERNEREARRQEQAAVAAQLLAEQREDEARKARKLAEDNAAEAAKQTGIALANAKVAREQTDVAVKTLSTVIYDLQRDLKLIPNGGALRRKLLNTALDRLTEISAEFARDEIVDHQKASALMELADVFRQIGVEPDEQDGDAGTSRLKVAEDLYEQALAMLSQLATEHPGNAKAQLAPGIALGRLGDIHRARGDLKTAMEFYGKASESRAECLKTHPDNSEVKRDYSVSLGKQAMGYAAMKEFDTAIELLNQTFEIQQELAAQSPDDRDAQADLAVCLTNLGNLYWNKRHLVESFDCRKRALGIFEGLAAAEPSNALRKLSLADSLASVGWAANSLGKRKDARDYLLRSLAIREHRASADPDNMEAQRVLASTYNSLGMVSMDSQEFDEAVAFYEKGLGIRKKLSESEPANISLQNSLAKEYAVVGGITERVGKLEQSAGYYQQALTLRKQIAESSPDLRSAQLNVVRYHNHLGRVKLKQDETREALAIFEQSLALLSALEESDPADQDARSMRADVYRYVGDAKLQENQLTAAEEQYRQCVTVLEGLLEEDASDAPTRYRLAKAWNALSNVSLQRGNIEKMLALSEQELSVFRKLVAEDPASHSRHFSVAEATERIAKVCRDKGRKDEAAGYFREAVDTRKEMARLKRRSWGAVWNLSLSHMWLGDALRDLREYPDALDQYRAGVALLEELIRREELVENANTNLKAFKHRIASVRLRQIATGEWGEVLKHAERSPILLYYRASEFAASREFDKAAEAAEKLQELAAGKADDLYNAACAWCSCAAGVTAEDDQPLTKEDEERRGNYLKQAMSCMEDAVAAGYDNVEHARKDPDLLPLADLPQFKKLVSDAAAKQNPEKE